MTTEALNGYVTESINDYKQGLGWLHMKTADVVDTYEAFTAACFADGALSEKDKHVVALGISIHAQDEYCIMYHATRALECGATSEELCETIAVATALGGGAAMAQGVTLVHDVIQEFERSANQNL